MPMGQIENPLNAFGYQTTVAGGQRQSALHSQTIRVFRNGSRAPLVYGQTVALYVDGPTPYGSSAGGTTAQTGTTCDDAVYVTTTPNQAGVIGITLGACSSATGLTSVANFSPRFNGPSSQYVSVVTEGPFFGALMSSNASTGAQNSGDIVFNGASTVSKGLVVPFGGTLTVATTAGQVVTSGAVNQRASVGWLITTGTTVASTLYGSSGSYRANIWVRPCNYAVASTV